MVIRFLLSIACCGFIMQEKTYSATFEELNLESPSKFLLSIDKKNVDTGAISEDLEWKAIAEEKKEDKARAYIYSFFLNPNSYDLKCFLEKNGLSVDSVPSCSDFLAGLISKQEVEENLGLQIKLLSEKLNISKK